MTTARLAFILGCVAMMSVIAFILGCVAMMSVIGVGLVVMAILSDAPTSEDLEHEVRVGLPLGTSLSMVQDFFARRGLEFSYDASSKSVRAIKRSLKGSTVLVRKSLTLRFDFDPDLKLRNLDAKVVYTGL